MRRPGLRLARLQIADRKLQNPQRGYILIALMLAVTLAAILALAIIPRVEQQIQRDREEELRHRGSQYMRAIQHYYKKFGRYPTRIEELENTNQIRFLRKRYKDPMASDKETHKEKDFKILHQQDIGLNGPLLGQAGGLGALGGLNGPGGLPGQPGLAGGNSGVQGALAGALGGALGAQRTAAQAQPQNDSDDSEGTPAQGSPGNPNSGQVQSSDSPASSDPNTKISSAGATIGGNGPVFGGGPFLGVASTSKAKSIRVFNKKDRYNDWLFIYDPTSDRGGLLIGPWQTGVGGSLGGNGLGQNVQNLSQPAGGIGPGAGGSQPFGSRPQQPTQPPTSGDNSEN